MGEVSAIEVSPEVYEILEMTGFTELMPVTKAFRRLDVTGCEQLGEGGNGIVYRLNPETVVKVYKKPDALPEIYRERELARKAFVLGLPTAIPFDIVRVGERFGSVFELLNARSVTKSILQDPEHIDDYIAKYVVLLKLIHGTADPKREIPEKKAVVLDWAPQLRAFLDEEAVRKFIRLVEALPDGDTLIHGDYHINNVELQNGEVMLIDMDTLSLGHPVFDIAGMHMAYIGFPMIFPENSMNFFGLDNETCLYIWEKSTAAYGGSEEAVREIREKGTLLSSVILSRWIFRHCDVQDPKIRPVFLSFLKIADEGLKKADTLAF